MAVIKFLRSIAGLFNWSTSSSPTSEQDYMVAVKNWQETERNLVDCTLWQPTTAYAINEILHTPSMLNRFVLRCKTAGTSGANEPDYTNVSLFDEITDGTVVWVVDRLATQSGIQMDNPSSRNAYNTIYTGVTRGTAPSANQGGYGLSFTDSAGDAMGGVNKYLYSSGATDLRLYDITGNSNSPVSHAIFVHHESDGTPSVRPYPNNEISLGTAGYKWTEVFASTATINTSDERIKDNIEAIDDDVLDAWGEVQWYQFQFRDALAKKGANARIHTGLIAQRIKSVFEAHDLDPFRYGLLCYDEWGADDNQQAGNLYSLRYEEALCMESAYQRRRADRLEARIEALERS